VLLGAARRHPVDFGGGLGGAEGVRAFAYLYMDGVTVALHDAARGAEQVDTEAVGSVFDGTHDLKRRARIIFGEGGARTLMRKS